MAARSVEQLLPTFRPLVAPRGLTDQLVARIAADITGGRLPPGSKLPTEREMMAATGVSRTVVREAVACLRADGLVTVRQGVGAFVAEHVRRPFRIEVDELDSLREALDVMELRAGVEIEAAGLAAERHNSAHIKKIAEAFRRIEDAVGRGEFGGRRGLFVSLQHRRRHRQCAVQALSRLSRPFHHSAPEHPQEFSRASRISALISSASRTSTWKSSMPSAPVLPPRRAPRCGVTWSTAASAIKNSWPRSAMVRRRPRRRKFCQSRGFFMQTVLVTGAAGGIGTRLRKLA